MPVKVTCKGLNLSLNLMLFRAFGERGDTSEMLAKALKLNPGLAGRGLEIPIGTDLVLPDPPVPAPVTRRVVNMWED